MAVIEALPKVRLKYDSGQVTQPADPPYLEHRFQDWLADPIIGLMRRNPWAKKLLEEDLSRVGGHQDTGELTRRGQLLQFLLSQEGYLVSRARVAEVLYNGYSGPCEISATDQICHDLRNRLRDPKLLYRRVKIGMGVGIEDFRPQLFGLQLLYPLWRNLGDWVTLSDLVHEVYNDAADNFIIPNVNAIRPRILQLRKILSDGYVAIETRRSSFYQEGAYRLVES